MLCLKQLVENANANFISVSMCLGIGKQAKCDMSVAGCRLANQTLS